MGRNVLVGVSLLPEGGNLVQLFLAQGKEPALKLRFKHSLASIAKNASCQYNERLRKLRVVGIRQPCTPALKMGRIHALQRPQSESPAREARTQGHRPDREPHSDRA